MCYASLNDRNTNGSAVEEGARGASEEGGTNEEGGANEEGELIKKVNPIMTLEFRSSHTVQYQGSVCRGVARQWGAKGAIAPPPPPPPFFFFLEARSKTCNLLV